MSILTAVVFSMFLLTVTGCVASSSPPAAKQETGKKDSTVKPAKHDEGKSMNEESQDPLPFKVTNCDLKSDFSHFALKGAVRLSFTARIERPRL
jgi:hypothetical protein